MKNTTNLVQIDGGNQIKQGDHSSLLGYRLVDERMMPIMGLEGQEATVMLMRSDCRQEGEVRFATSAVVSEGVVSFVIDKAISTGSYSVEVSVGGYVFPSDTKTTLTIVQGAKQYTADDLEELPEVAELYRQIEVLARKKHEFEFRQTVASAIWVIEHDLMKYPAVSVVDSGGNEVVGDVQYISTSKVTVTFSAPFSGVAYLN